MENNSQALTILGPEDNRKKFSWEARRDISLGIARGIAYLQEEVQPYIVHRDIKSGNILLDQNFVPKVADFGLSKLFRNNISHISTHVAGTLGYLAPEYALSGHLTRKSVVYGFGVLLLEICSGEPIISYDLEHGEHYLVQKAWKMHKSDKLLQLVDPTLKHDLDKVGNHSIPKDWASLCATNQYAATNVDCSENADQGNQLRRYKYHKTWARCKYPGHKHRQQA